MINQPPPELFPSDRPVQSNFARPKSYRIRRSVTVFIALVLIGGGSYEIYLWKRTPPVIPTIHAEGSLKQKPEQPGGIDIPNQDVTAYQQIDNTEAKATQGEHLLPPPETPQASVPAMPSSSPKMQAAVPGNASIENLIAPPSVPIQTTVTSPENAAETVPPPADTPATMPTVQKSEAVAPAAAPAEPAPTPAPAAEVTSSSPKPAESAPAKPASDTPKKVSAGKGGYRVQLASIPDEQMARQEMSKMQDKYVSQLNGSKLHLVKADLGARGIYYRVQSADAMTDADARNVCAAIKNLKAGCIVVRP